MSEKMDWNDAMKYAESLGEGWRLPSLKELMTLWDYEAGKSIVPINPSPYWSSSTYASYPHYAWYVNFNKGYVSYDDKYGYNFYVRCVRGGQ